MKYLKERADEISTILAILVVTSVTFDVVDQSQVDNFLLQVDQLQVRLTQVISLAGSVALIAAPDSKLTAIKNKLLSLFK